MPALALAAAACNGKGSASHGSGDVVGGCTYTRTPGQCKLAATEVVDASSDDPTLATVRATYRWVGEPPPEMRDPMRVVEWQVPRARVDQVRAHADAHATVACRIEISNGPCPPQLMIDPDALPAPPAPTGDARAAICPPEPPSPLNRAVAGVGTEALMAAFPLLLDRARVAGAADWRRESAHGAKAGTAGRWADEATAYYAKKGARVQVVIDDMIRVCTGAAGSTDGLLDTEEIQDPATIRRRLGVLARSAVLVTWAEKPPRSRLVVWIGDRCRVSLDPSDTAAPEELGEVARGLDLDALEAACKKR